MSIELSFDATGLTLGECYTGTLKFEYNDPYITEEFVPRRDVRRRRWASVQHLPAHRRQERLVAG